MSSSLPATPADVLRISTQARRLRIGATVKAAELFRFWSRPYDKAAASFEEMAPTDIFYWVYKCRNPIVRPEPHFAGEVPFSADAGVVGLPSGFESHRSLTLGAGGDLFRCSGLDDSKGRLFEKVTDLLFDQTVSYANLESPITEQALREEVFGGGRPPIECCSREQFETLMGHDGRNFTVLHTANNHIFDMGVEGLETTQRVLGEEAILDVGTNRAPADFGKGKVLVRNGIKIGFAGASLGLNGRVLPEAERYRIHLARLCSRVTEPELDLLKRQIDDCKAQGCDFVIASLHWGYEFEFFPRKHQRETAHRLVEHGADAILGHHPHVIQPVEYYRTSRDPERVAVIAYSLGSLTWGFTAPYLVLSAILNLTLSKGLLAGEVRTYIGAAKVSPVFRSHAEQGGKITARIEKLADHRDGRSDTHPRATVAAIERYADLVLGGLA